MSGGSGGSQTSVTELPGYVRPYAVSLMGLADNIATTPYESYGGKMLADMAPQQQQALAMTEARALNGNPAMNVAKHQATGTMMGDFLYRDTGLNPFVGDNPYLDSVIGQTGRDMADAYARGTGASTLDQFNAGGAFGGSAHREMTAANNRAFADSLGQMSNNARMQNYNQSAGLYENYLNRNEQAFQAERGNQLAAMGFAPTLAQNDYTDIQALAGVGDITRGYAQDVLNSDYQQWLQAQQYPMQQMDILSAGIQGAMGGGVAQSRSTQLPGASPIAGALGGAAAGSAIMPGWGTAIGAALGYLGSQ